MQSDQVRELQQLQEESIGQTALGVQRRTVIACLGLLTWACSARAARGAGGPLRRPWDSRGPAPSLTLPRLDGGIWDLSSSQGRVVAVNFWASWCEPCRVEMPSLELLAARYESDGLVVVAVNYRETDAAIHRFLDQLPTTLSILRDRDGAAARDWGVRMFPTTVIVGRDGRVRFSIVGEADWTGKEAQRWLAPLLQARA